MPPQTTAADITHQMKYRQAGETFRDCANRVAAGLKDNDAHYHIFREILNEQRFSPAGRIQAAIGSLKSVTAFNCFATGTIADSYVDGDGSIMDRAKEAAATMRMGGGIGYDFSTLRPKGALIKKLQSHSGGPLAFMEIFNAVCKCTASSGHRRGAQMGILRVDHPNILDFVNAKHDESTLTGFNISVAVTDEFMSAVLNQTSFDLRFNGEVYQTIDACALWEAIMRSTWDWAEPGVIFIDTINRNNNLWYCETIAATNPCAEQPLPPYGACLLGSFNLVKYLSRQPLTVQDLSEGKTSKFTFDIDQLKADIPHVVRAMDNVTDRSFFPLPQQKAEAKSKRRMGLGVMGLANALEAMGIPYGSQNFISFQNKILKVIANESYRASANLAAEKGSFPLYQEDAYLKSVFVQTLDKDVQNLIKENGIRNSHLTSIAPTGTISMCNDNISSSCEPVFSYGGDRPINTPTGPVVMSLQDYGAKFLGVHGKRAHEVTMQEHVDVLLCAASNVDSSVSKTINCDGKTPWEDFKSVYFNVWAGGGKGCATFNKDGKRFGLISSTDDEKDQSCTYDPETGKATCEG